MDKKRKAEDKLLRKNDKKPTDDNPTLDDLAGYGLVDDYETEPNRD